MSVRADIQGLRGMAVLLVVLGHAGVPGIRGGYVGVDVFFVVSGFLIGSLLLREAARTGRISIAGFYARRARRILPAATVVLVAISVFAGLRLGPSEAGEINGDVRWSALFLANVHFAHARTDYFAIDEAPSPLQHYWSLAVEEQFYLVWPLVLLLLLSAPRRARVAAGPDRARSRLRWVALVVVVAWAVSLGWSVLSTPRTPTAAYFSSATRAWELATGVLLALAAGRLSLLRRPVRHLLATGGLAAVAVAGLTFSDSTSFPGWHALLPVLGTAAVVAAGCGVERAVGTAAMLSRRPLTWVGDISYSLYLWHWPFLVLGERFVPGDRPALSAAALVALSLLAATLTYHLVENPFRRSDGVLRRRGPALVLWPAALSLVLSSTAWSVDHSERVAVARTTRVVELPGVPVVERARSAALPEPRSPDPVPVVESRVEDAVRRAERDAPIPFPLVNLTGLGGDIFLDDWDCAAGWTGAEAELCPIGDLESAVVVVAIGDSYLSQWLPAIDKAAEWEHLRVVPLVKYGCAPFDVDQEHRGDPDFRSCPAFRRWATRQVARLRPDLVLVGFRGMFHDVAEPGKTREESWSDGVESTLTRLTALGRVEVMSGISPLSFKPSDCITAPGSDMGTCTSGQESDEILANRLTEDVARRLGVPYVDVTPLVCHAGRCPAVVDRTVVRHDAAHITRTWSLQVASALGDLLDLRRVATSGPPVPR